MKKRACIFFAILLIPAVVWADFDYNRTRQAAERGDANAQFNLGLMLYQGKVVARDRTEAVKWFRNAAEQGNEKAQLYLGLILYYDYGKDVKEDKAEAAEWFRKAAEQGNAAAQNGLGCILYACEGAACDYDQARHWFIKAALQGRSYAMSYLGDMYEKGKGVAKDKTKAEKWFNKALKTAEEDIQKEKNAGSLNRASWVFLFSGRFEEAGKFANEGLSIDSGETWVRVNLAHALLLQGKNDAALAEYGKCRAEHATPIKEDLKILKIRFPEKASLFDDTLKALGL